jgi:hypothetical protein
MTFCAATGKCTRGLVVKAPAVSEHAKKGAPRSDFETAAWNGTIYAIALPRSAHSAICIDSACRLSSDLTTALQRLNI